jgi:hypothetical protein
MISSHDNIASSIRLASLEETILPPPVGCWGEHQSLIQRFLAESNHEIGPILQALESFVMRDI